MGGARHQPHGELAGERLGRLLVHGREHIVEQHAERVLARVHGRDDARFVTLERDDPVLGHCVLQPLKVLERLRVRDR